MSKDNSSDYQVYQNLPKILKTRNQKLVNSNLEHGRQATVNTTWLSYLLKKYKALVLLLLKPQMILINIEKTGTLTMIVMLTGNIKPILF